MREQQTYKPVPKAPPNPLDYQIIIHMAASADDTVGTSQLRRNLLTRAMEKGSKKVGSFADLFTRSSRELEHAVHQEYTRALNIMSVTDLQVRVVDLRRNRTTIVIVYNGMRELQTATCHQPVFYL